MRSRTVRRVSSSPSIALFKDGKLVYFMPRHRIEGRDAESVARDLQAAFSEHGMVAGTT